MQCKLNKVRRNVRVGAQELKKTTHVVKRVRKELSNVSGELRLIKDLLLNTEIIDRAKVG